jgi:hypothetical protein
MKPDQWDVIIRESGKKLDNTVTKDFQEPKHKCPNRN